MDTATREALEKSIQHWRENAEAEAAGEASLGTQNCALCKMFFCGLCKGCPISESTGTGNCDGSPYQNALIAHLGWVGRPKSIARRDAFRTAARAELDFLISLREEAKTSDSSLTITGCDYDRVNAPTRAKED